MMVTICLAMLTSPSEVKLKEKKKLLPYITFNGGNYICTQHLSGPFHSVGCDFAIVAWPPAEIMER